MEVKLKKWKRIEVDRLVVVIFRPIIRSTGYSHVGFTSSFAIIEVEFVDHPLVHLAGRS